ncbi:NADH-quinone oxidoreductase subunit L [Pacificimonas flava]|uniref:NADH-ubiquinone oxidoreductase chain 5 n=1 Tax=Pacificimonas flava TaxID=1234595 RepID=M2U8H0_9SPHN|nr:NADH-quinone oxidoreductase subunit L [Pacificimonas flava]EMD84278.1 NADH-ubiquinone oxidoreductase chain L [Pacificimonas flava]MBB5279846.1 NADH-quinone oxidoreductase subunit L [Pacificimonas flava]
MLQIVVFLPLLTALVAGLGNRALGNMLAKSVTTGGLFISAALSWVIFFQVGFGDTSYVEPVMDWFRSGDLDVNWALRLDTLTAVMLIVVTTVSALVHLYSWGYMAEDPDQPRFFAYLSLFTFAMLMLVTADNLVQLFFGWEGVGLASYLLIGFWYYKPSANAAAIKAFVVNRVGDFGFSLGIFGVFMVFGTTDISAINSGASALTGQTITFLGAEVDLLTTLCLLLFVGAMGKSAQLGLHTWLPDAMEGPTPVSALIHAATMVTAGVFMVCRLSPLFEAAPAAMTVVTYVGAATALFAATVGTVQTDIKRVIAYSTCSQLGYMFFAAGVGAYGAAMFHLFTHAFFKALLFLGAGSVIHAMHHEQDMRHYGALRKEIPLTYWAMMFGTLAITGVGIPLAGIGFAGFYSKDMIIESAFAAGSQAGYIAFAVGVFAALLTSFYSWRLVFLTFFGEARWAGSEHVQHAVHDHPSDEDSGDEPAHPAKPLPATGTGGYHPHESPVNMLVPLGVLSLGAIFAGFLGYHVFVGEESGSAFWRGSIAFSAELIEHAHHVPTWVKLSPFIAMLTGLAIAWWNYIYRPEGRAGFVSTFRGLYNFLLNKWYFDELYHYVFMVPAMWLGRFFWKRGDEGTIDRFGPNGLSALVVRGSGVARYIQSGYLYTYALVMLIGLAAAAAWFLPQALGGQ